jgi:hypothetical protein
MAQSEHPTATDDLRAARLRVRRERRRTVDEREAFDAFVEALAAIPADDAPTGLRAGTRLLDRQATAGATAVREAYERTVMSVPHYEAEYGDDYRESLRAEFGEAAAALADGTLHPQAKRGLVSAARVSQEERAGFVPPLDREAASLRDCEERLVDVLEELVELHEEPFPALDFGALDATRARLEVLDKRVDAVGADRQATLRDQRRELSLGAGVPDVPTYLYQSLDVTYPALDTVARTADAVERCRRRVERAIARV